MRPQELATAVRIGPDGWAEGVRRLPSPHFDERPEGGPIDLLVVHFVSLPPGKFGTGCPARLFTGTLDLSEDPSFESLRGLRVSPHFLIERSGRVTQFVSCAKRAWHAGASSFEGRCRCNDFSIGIELEGTERDDFTSWQYASLETLAEAVVLRYPVRAVAGHSDIAPGRKIDPGPRFDWGRLATPKILALGVDFPYLEKTTRLA